MKLVEAGQASAQGDPNFPFAVTRILATRGGEYHPAGDTHLPAFHRNRFNSADSPELLHP